jgi:hypothetical protein
VVGRRGDQTDTRGGVAGSSNLGGDLVAGQLTALTRLSTLCHLDLKLVGVGEVGGGDTETSGGDLLDGRAHGVAVLQRGATLEIFTTLTSVGLATEPVHGHGDGRVGLHRDRTVRHSASNEAANNLGPRLDLVDGDGVACLEVEVEETTERAVLDGLVRGPRVCLVRLVVLGPHGILDVGNGGRIVNVRLSAVTPVVLASLSQTRDFLDSTARVALLVKSEGILCNLLKSHTTDTSGSTSEAAVDNGVIDTESLENLGSLVTLKSGDTHFTHDLQDTAVNGVLVVLNQLLLRELAANQTLTVELQDTLVSKVRVDGIGTVANQYTHVVYLASLGGLYHKGSLRTPSVADHVVVDHTSAEQGGNSNTVRTSFAIGQDEDLVALLNGLGSCLVDAVQSLDVARDTLGLGECDVNGSGGPVRVNLVDFGQGVELLGGEDGRGKVQPVALLLVHLEQIALGSDVSAERHDDCLTNGVDRRVSDLCEKLAEVLRKKTRLLSQTSQRCIVTHGTKSLLRIGSHWRQNQSDLLK